MLTVNQTNQLGEANNTNKLLVPQVDQVLEMMKLEIAEEMGIQLNGDTTARICGKVGGEITKRLIQMGKESLVNQTIH